MKALIVAVEEVTAVVIITATLMPVDAAEMPSVIVWADIPPMMIILK